MLNEGVYFGKPVEFGTAETDKGTPYFFIEVEVAHMAQGEGWAPVQPTQKRTIYMYLTDKSIEWTQNDLATLGFNGDFQTPAFSGSTMEGVQVECVHEMFDGKTRDKWSLRGKSREKKAPSDDTIRRLNGMWKASEHGRPTPAASPAPAAIPAPNVQPAAGEPPDDVAPF